VLPYLFMLLLMIALFAMTLLTYTLEALGERSVRLLAVDRSLAHAVEWLLRLANFAGLVHHRDDASTAAARDNHRGVVGGMSADRCDRAQPRR
jgi:hypothetical protein